MNDLDHDLRDAARDIDVPSGDLDAVVARGRRRARRRHRVLGATAVIAVAGASLTVVGLAAGDDDGAPVTALGSPSASTGDTGMTWTAVEPRSALAMLRVDPSVEAGGRLYALSTAPGEADPNATEPSPMRLWSSSDAVDWEPGPDPDADLYLSDLAARDDRIYAIGTGQATAAVVDGRAVPSVNVGWTDGDGGEWTSSPLDIDYAAIAEHATSVNVVQRSVAAGPAGVVALVGVNAELDVPEVVPAGDPAPERWAITDDGVIVLGEPHEDVCPDEALMKPGRGDEPEGPHRVWPTYCGERDGRSTMVAPEDAYDVERSYTWDDLGVDGDLRQAVLGHPFAFAGDAEGTAFDRVALPPVAGVVSWATVEGGDAGFDVVLSTIDSRLAYVHSDDGRSWFEGPTPADLSWASAAGSLGGRTVLTGSDAQNHPVVLLRDPGASWQSVRIDSLLDPDRLDGRAVYSASAAVGPLGIAQVVIATDDERGDMDTFLVFSRDGQTWETTSLDDVAGSHVNGTGRVVVTDSRVVVMVTPTQERADDGHLRQIAVVGTPS